MERILYGIFFNENGIFNGVKAGIDCAEQKEKAKRLLAELNEKIGTEGVSNLQLKVLFEIVAELAASSDNREICDLFYDVQNIMTNAFLSVEECEEIKGE